VDNFHNINFLNLLKFGRHKQLTKHTSNILLLSELWMFYAPLTW